MDKVICFGSAGKDVFFPTDEGRIIETPEDLLSQKKIAFELGAKVRVKDRQESLGGVAANVAVGLSRLGIETLCASAIGDDELGDWTRKKLQENKVNVDLVMINQGRKSDFSAIVVDATTADRVIFTNYTSSGDFKLNEENTKPADWFFIGDIHGKWEDQMEKIFTLAKDGDKKVAFNPREAGIQEDAPEIIEAIGLSEIVFVNKDEAIEIVSNMHVDADPENVNDEKYLIEKLKSLEPKIVVLTDGTRGAWASDGEHLFHAEAMRVAAVDSTGAGDSFTSSFLAAYIKGKSLRECLQWGIANSASEVQKYGAIEGLLNEEEILEKAKDIEAKEL